MPGQLEIDSQEKLERAFADPGNFAGSILQGLDLSGVESRLLDTKLALGGTYFLGCIMSQELSLDVQRRGAFVFPRFQGFTYEPFRHGLYNAAELYDRYDPAVPGSYKDCLDNLVYQEWRDQGGPSPQNLVCAMAQRLHDESINDAATEFLQSMLGAREGVVAIMGGHDMVRGNIAYMGIAMLAKRLTERGYLMVSGGGPGAMEATHLGAWFAGRSEDELVEAARLMSSAPTYEHPQWLALAFTVMRQYPPLAGDRHLSLGVPTWLYGHEPPTPFATHIAKYFANSLREDGLVTIATAGIIFAPGSAGTIQEIFQDLTQNHYLTTGMASAMVFYGVDYWTRVKPVYPLVCSLAAGKLYEKQLALTDDIDGAMQFILTHKPLVPHLDSEHAVAPGPSDQGVQS